jgi:hypothetical protein
MRTKIKAPGSRDTALPYTAAPTRLRASAWAPAAEVHAPQEARDSLRLPAPFSLGREAGHAGPGAVVQRQAAESDTGTQENTVSPADVTVTNNATGVSDHALQVLKEIVSGIKETSATITSGTRTPAEQAQAMYDNCHGLGATSQYALYGSFGDQVVAVYEEGVAAELGEAVIVQNMTDKINELGPSNVSKHCSADHQVIDVAPSSIQDDDAFQTGAEGHASVSRYLGPNTTPSDPAHHLEIE